MDTQELIAALPDRVRERVHVVSGGAAQGSFVLYWMHHAVRGHDNPALDAAIHAGARLGLPVLAYQGLGGRHRFNSDRHHLFILQGAREVQPQLAARGVRHVLHLPSDPTAPSPLTTLAADSALIVTEDFPAPPFPAWTARLAARTGTPLWCVDERCLVPARRVAPFCDRAFRFREQTSDRFAAELVTPWRDTSERAALHEASLPFAPIDLPGADLAALVGRCEIDHSVGPVPHTVGGATAGYARWRRFLERGLRGYARRRNDPLVDGVSRMSAYLHHGHVSPWRLASEAWRHGGAGAEKFLDELLVWRELAHHVCLHLGDRVERLDGLPDWAQRTLEQHAGDMRPAVLSGEALARGRSGDRLWDAAQTSLLVHGELHNNVRMTWGKALLQWTATPQEALARLIDLNHRYALDGSDPSSYGGLLWCLGLLDRPFTPEQPCLGTVRPRPTAAHAARLDVARYERAVRQPARAKRLSVAVVGAGVAGLTAGRVLADHRLDVAVFDKGRGPGGRASRRRHAEHVFDHGAQYFTARDPGFVRHVRSWRHEGVVAPWTGRIVSLEADGTAADRSEGTQRYVGVPGMSAVARHLSADLDIVAGRRVERLERGAAGWTLHLDDDGRAGPFDAVLLTAPAPQTAALLGPTHPDLAVTIGGVVMDPCWAVMAAFARPLPLPYDGAFVNHGPLSWIARDSSKPGRPPGERWVLHAGPGWSRAHLELEPSEAAPLLLEAFADATGADPGEHAFAGAHRWRYALPAAPLAERCIFDDASRIGAAGDWCGGPRVEGAFLSGVAAAGRVLGLPDEACSESLFAEAIA